MNSIVNSNNDNDRATARRTNVLLIGSVDTSSAVLRELLQEIPDAAVNVVWQGIREEQAAELENHGSCTITEKALETHDLYTADLILIATNNITLQEQVHELRRLTKKEISIHNVNPGSGAGKNNNTDDRPQLSDDAIATGDKGSSNFWRRIMTWSLIVFGVLLLAFFAFTYFPFGHVVSEGYKWYQALDSSFPIMLLAGFAAQLVDGALGMGYGVTSATILLSAGVNPAAISGSIHTAEMFASGASGYSHYKFGNVNKKLFRALLVPGVIGAVAGAVLLVMAGEKYGSIIRPAIAVYTLVLGIKFIMNAFRGIKPQKKFRRYKLLAGVGGFFDSFGGGGWGPIVTSTLINNGRSHKYVVGSVSLTEFFVTLASAFTFFTMIGVSHWQTILGLIIGGLVAAPIAAKLAGKLPRKTAFILLGTLVIIWSVRILVKII